MRHADQWARRAKHEASIWDINNLFATLTYDDEHLPQHGSVLLEHIQNFTKRLRIQAKRHPETILGDRTQSPRYINCAEYGERYQRAHYHYLAFNCLFADAKQITTRNGLAVYESKTLKELWPYGISEFGIATPGNAAGYMNKYMLKATNKRDEYDPETGELTKHKEFFTMSKKPPIGYGWLTKYQDDLRNGYVGENGFKKPIPRAYIRQLQKINPELVETLLATREQHRIREGPRGDVHPAHPDRQLARDVILTQQLSIANQRRTL
jgi:hypothetical protein